MVVKQTQNVHGDEFNMFYTPKVKLERKTDKYLKF